MWSGLPIAIDLMISFARAEISRAGYWHGPCDITWKTVFFLMGGRRWFFRSKVRSAAKCDPTTEGIIPGGSRVGPICVPAPEVRDETDTRFIARQTLSPPRAPDIAKRIRMILV